MHYGQRLVNKPSFPSPVRAELTGNEAFAAALMQSAGEKPVPCNTRESIMKIAHVIGAGIAGLMLATAPALAEVINFTAELSGDQEVPPADTTGSGMLEATYDTETMEFTWTVNYEGLTGDAVAAHFHGPAAAGENAGPVVPIEGDLASPIEGSAMLTEEQATQLQDGMWYFNIHTAQYPDGEIRGQVMQGDAAAGADAEAPAEEEPPQTLTEDDDN